MEFSQRSIIQHKVLSKLVTMYDSSRMPVQASQETDNTNTVNTPDTGLLYNLLGDLYSVNDQSGSCYNFDKVAKQELSSYINMPSLSTKDCPLAW